MNMSEGVRCPECGAACDSAGGIPADDEKDGLCPSCRFPLDPTRVHTLTQEDFQALIPSAEVPVLVDFYAEWCAPCRWLEPILAELATTGRGRYLVAKVDTEEAPGLAERFRIGSVPTVILFREGREVARSLGVEPERLRSFLRIGDGPAMEEG